MEQLPLVAHQEPNWDSKINNVINFLNSNWGGVAKRLSVSDWTDEGIVYLNGFQHQSDGTKSAYRYIDLGNGDKIVELRINLIGPRYSDKSISAAILPDLVKNQDNIVLHYWGQQLYMSNGKIDINADKASDKDQFIGHCFYFHK